MISVANENASTGQSDPALWVEQHGDYLYAYALMRARNQAVAEDLVQETFLAAIKASVSYAGKSSEKTWLTGILKHKIYDYFRSSSSGKSQMDLTGEEADLSGYNHFFERDDEWNGHWNRQSAPADWNNPAQSLQDSEFQTILRVCLSGLPPRVANAFTLREMDGLESREICEVLGVSAGNLGVMMHRARLHLRRCIEINWFNNAHRRA